MRIKLQNGVFVAESSYDEKDAVKRAGFWWHGQPCRPDCGACKAQVAFRVWWTPKKDAAARLVDYADDDVKAAVANVVEAIEASKAVDAEIDVPAPEHLAYKPFQKGGIAYSLSRFRALAEKAERGGVLIADEMGLGKSIQTLGVINADPSIKTVLLICPASLRLNWLREARKWLVRDFKFHVVEGFEAIPNDASFVIVNYDRLVGGFVPCGACDATGTKRLVEAYGEERVRRADANFERLPAIQCDKCKGTGKVEDKDSDRRDVFDSIMARIWDLACLDEGHVLKNTRSQRAQAVLGRPAKRASKGKAAIEAASGIVDRAARRLILTGTPILNKPIEMQPLLAQLAPKEFGNFMYFAKRYCAAELKTIGRKSFWDFSGASHLDELQNRLRSTCMVRRLKADVLKELPDKVRQLVLLPVNGTASLVKAEIDDFDDAETERRTELQAEAELAHASGDKDAYQKAIDALEQVEAIAFRKISKARHRLALAKVEKVLEHLDGVAAEGVEKFVVFAHHRDVIEKIAKHFGEAAVTLTGETSLTDRQAAVDRFQNDPTCKVFIGNILAAGVGITLTAASHVFFAELDWRPAFILQAEDRLHRIGQKNTVFVYHLVIDGSLDARMAAIILAKQRVADAALDTTTEIPVIQGPQQAPRPAQPIKSVAGDSDSNGQRASSKPRDFSLPPMISKGGTPIIYPVATSEQRTAAKSAMQILALMCDGAHEIDGVGFSKIDTRVGKALAMVMSDYTDGQTYLATRLARTYRRQLSMPLREILGINPAVEEAA